MSVLKNRVKTNPGICSQCDKVYGSCCKLRKDSRDDMPAPISEPEIQKILKTVTNQFREDLFETKENSPVFINQMAALFPDMAHFLDKIFPLNKTHYQLKTIGNACIFLSATGCTLPDHARPLFCRIYPFWFFDDQPQIFQDHCCLAIQKCKTIPELLLSLGTTSENLRQTHRQILQCWEFYSAISPVKIKASM